MFVHKSVGIKLFKWDGIIGRYFGLGDVVGEHK